MYAPSHNPTQVYGHSAAEHIASTADGYTLIRSLLSKLLGRLGVARHNLSAGDIPAKGEQIGHAVDIINVLQVAIDDSHDATLAGNLASLYDYMARRLVEANLHNDVGRIDEVTGLVREVKSAWDAIGEQRAD